ncbi:hypothetical protein D3C86_1297330 [compost metagenome]
MGGPRGPRSTARAARRADSAHGQARAVLGRAAQRELRALARSRPGPGPGRRGAAGGRAPDDRRALPVDGPAGRGPHGLRRRRRPGRGPRPRVAGANGRRGRRRGRGARLVPQGAQAAQRGSVARHRPRQEPCRVGRPARGRSAARRPARGPPRPHPGPAAPDRDRAQPRLRERGRRSPRLVLQAGAPRARRRHRPSAGGAPRNPARPAGSGGRSARAPGLGGPRGRRQRPGARPASSGRRGRGRRARAARTRGQSRRAGSLPAPCRDLPEGGRGRRGHPVPRCGRAAFPREPSPPERKARARAPARRPGNGLARPHGARRRNARALGRGAPRGRDDARTDAR